MSARSGQIDALLADFVFACYLGHRAAIGLPQIATICLSVNRLFLIGSSLSKSHLSRNHWYEETKQVTAR